MNDQLIRDNQRGSALFMTVMILTSIMTIAFGVADVIIPGIRMARTQNYSTRAYFAAESGAERALWEVRKNGYTMPATTTPNIFTDTFAFGSSYDVDYATTSAAVTFTANGMHAGTRRSIQITFTQ